MITLADLGGLWRREILTAPGVHDDTSQVFWAQGALDFADVRVPAGLEAISADAGLRDLTPDQAEALSSCDGFAGTTSVEDSVCRWTRLLNYRGPLTGDDVGRLSWKIEGEVLIEDGTEEEYSETWTLIDDSPFQTAVFGGNGDEVVRLVWSGAHFLMARSSPRSLGGMALTEAVASGAWAAFDQEFVLGPWDNGVGLALVSTQPWRRGSAVIEFQGDAVLRVSCCREACTTWETMARLS